MRFVLLPGQRHATIGVPPPIEDLAFAAQLDDKAFDVDWLRAELDTRGAAAVMPPKADRKAAIRCDWAMYRWRHLIENYFAKLKKFRAVATCYDKTDSSFRATINLGRRHHRLTLNVNRSLFFVRLPKVSVHPGTG